MQCLLSDLMTLKERGMIVLSKLIPLSLFSLQMESNVLLQTYDNKCTCTSKTRVIYCYHFNISIVDNLIYHKTTDFETDFKIRPDNIKVIQVHNTYSGVAQFVKAEFQV